MNSHISRTSTFSAPVVQSRLEHHHQQQMLKQPEARQQHHQFHQRSKSLNNKGKRGLSHNHQQKVKETATSSSTPEITTNSRNSNKNFSNYSNNFDSSYHREQNVGYASNSNFLVDNGSNGQLQRKTSTSSRPSRRHKHSDSVDEDKLRVIPTISILKRPQSADFVKSNSKSTSSLDVTQEEQGNSNNHRSYKAWEKSPPSQHRSQSKERRRSDVTPSRSKRSQQRKEIRSMEFETDLTLNASTIQLSGSNDESDVNSNKYVKSHNNNTTTATQSNNAFIFPPLNYSNAIIALEEEMNSNKKEDTYSHSDDNATVKSSLNKNRIESTPRRLSSTAIELQSQVSRFAESDSESPLSLSPTYRRPPSSSPARLGGAPKLYAGPTFHNSPAPSDLPMPSFYGKSLGKEPLAIGINNLYTVPENVLSPPPVVHSNYDNYSSPSSGNTSDDDIFAMDDLESYYPKTSTLRKQRSNELLRILNARQHQTAAAYMVPERMATAHHPMHVYPSNDLNEISETLRNLLKIHGQ